MLVDFDAIVAATPGGGLLIFVLLPAIVGGGVAVGTGSAPLGIGLCALLMAVCIVMFELSAVLFVLVAATAIGAVLTLKAGGWRGV